MDAITVQKRVQRKCIFIDKEYLKECENGGKIGLFNTAVGKTPEALLGRREFACL